MKYRLIIDVTYDPATGSDKDAERALSFAAEYLASCGMLSFENGPYVDTWNSHVEHLDFGGGAPGSLENA